MKNYVLLLLVITFSCTAPNDKQLEAKDATIDSLSAKLEDCKAQAKIMADILEEERIEIQRKKAGH